MFLYVHSSRGQGHLAFECKLESHIVASQCSTTTTVRGRIGGISELFWDSFTSFYVIALLGIIIIVIFLIIIQLFFLPCVRSNFLILHIWSGEKEDHNQRGSVCIVMRLTAFLCGKKIKLYDKWASRISGIWHLTAALNLFQPAKLLRNCTPWGRQSTTIYHCHTMR